MVDIALNGAGRWGTRLIKAAAATDGRVRVVAASSRDAERQTEWAAANGVAALSWEEALDDRSIAAVIIATQHSRHAAEIIEAARAGKHVFVEKPLALTRADAVAAAEACAGAGVVLAHGYNRRFAPSFVDMERRVAAGEIGDLLHLEGQFSGPSGSALKPGMWRADPAECPAGAMTARGIHALDCLIALAGPVASVFAQSDRRVIQVPVDDVTSALLRFAGGATGYIASHHATGEIWRVQAYGSKGWIEMRSEAELAIGPVDGDVEQVTFAEVDEERAELEAFADAIAGTAAYPVTAAQAINAIAVVEAMVASSRANLTQTLR